MLVTVSYPLLLPFPSPRFPLFPLPAFLSPSFSPPPLLPSLFYYFPIPLGLAAQTVAENTWADNSWADIAKPRNSWAAFGVGPGPTWADSNPAGSCIAYFGNFSEINCILNFTYFFSTSLGSA